MEWHRSPKFLRLKAKWDAKLKKSGFNDIEYDEDHLKLSAMRFLVRDKGAYADPTLVQAKINYFSDCRKFLNDYKFKYKYERRIFELHSEGLSYTEIAKIVKLGRMKVYGIVKKLVEKMREG